ncbi:GMC family oxidoreductase N-terminal domain-containing protein [Aquamicrobium sp. LC103]|uniref:GMC family oxidoreductase n=1 Tax=Aquamicrobium sp. LC103 TaxID=1120658 RepID=UPI00063ECC16|nr:GMC family oxidoreductase N-terminal domain-containing protein [Aquamicrobium sp. LC103]TKT74520.1 choline dehydrogenase [Aquamicrobium sp. LC103]
MGVTSGEEFDYVIVGGGSAGAILAARLSEKPEVSVCLIEAGPRDKNPFIHIPAGFIKVIFDPGLTWGYETEPGPHIDNRKLPVIQGKLLGGSGSINGMVWVRGQRDDFDDWAAAGNEGWSYDDILPYYRKLERRIGEGEAEFRGRAGGIPVMDLSWKNKLVDAFMAGAQEIGIPYNADYNGRDQAGVGRYQYNIDRGKRYSAAKAYLKPAAGRRNLEVRTDALATRIVFEGRKAVGLEYRKTGDSTTRTVRARREVILCGGAVNSPKLLMLSGVGPSTVLNDAGVPVVHELAGLGQNYMDHYTPRLTYRAKNAVSINGLASGPRLLGQMLRWGLGMPSILGMGVVLGAAFWKTRPELNRPNIVVTFTPGTFKQGFLGRLDDFPGMTTGVWQLRPDSRGWMKIVSSDPMAKPSIQPNFLAEESDRRTAVEALRIARKIMATPQMAALTETETMPGIETDSDEELLAYTRSQGLCGYHASGTARMGRADDPMAVVDSGLRVHGMDGLRIVDASVMPIVVSGNTNAATMMIAEKTADMIRAG